MAINLTRLIAFMGVRVISYPDRKLLKNMISEFRSKKQKVSEGAIFCNTCVDFFSSNRE